MSNQSAEHWQVKSEFLSQSSDLYNVVAQKQITAKYNSISANDRISIDEREEFEQLCKGLNVSIEEKAQLNLLELEKNWEISVGNIPTIPSDIYLTRGEHLYFKLNCEWEDVKTVTAAYYYTNPNVSLSIMKGVTLRFGVVKFSKNQKDVLSIIDSGTIYLTNKKIQFLGAKGGKNIRLNRILDYYIDA